MGLDTTINGLVDLALRRNKRRNAEVESLIKSDVRDWMKDLFTAYPFWFLKVTPGYKFSSNFPLTQVDLDAATPISIVGYPGITHWLDRGVLRTEAGKSVYELFAPAEFDDGDQDGAFWMPAKSQKPLFCFNYTLKGTLDSEIMLPTPMVAQMDLQSVEGKPCVGYFESGREYDKIRLVPTPDKAYVIHLSWVLAESLPYFLSPADVLDDNWTTKFLQEYSEAATYCVMLKAAEYFGDIKQITFYQKELYGPNGDIRNPTGGKLGNIKKEHLRKARQESYSIPSYRSKPTAPGGPSDPWGRLRGRRR